VVRLIQKSVILINQFLEVLKFEISVSITQWLKYFFVILKDYLAYVLEVGLLVVKIDHFVIHI